jgi:antagonist of KipI
MISVLRPGMLTTIQDRGRWGWQHLGVPVAGPMDPFSFRLANLLVGNDEWAPALEITLMGPQLRVERDLVVALTGADLTASLPSFAPTRVAGGTVIRFGARRALTRAYLAVKGGIQTPVVLGSRAASLSSRLPGLAGRALRAGDALPVGIDNSRVPNAHAYLFLDMPRTGTTVRFLWGPDRDQFSDAAAEALVGTTFTLSHESNRMGYRLQGAGIEVSGGGQVLSEGSPVGSIQVPPSGQPILLMADRQTTGGYARIGTVITADLHVAGQLGPGDEIRFQPCEREAALAALREQEDALEPLRALR